MSGVKLSGRIKSFDKYSVILETNNQEQLIFKHAISTVVVSRPAYGSPAAPSGLHDCGRPGSPLRRGNSGGLTRQVRPAKKQSWRRWN